MTAEAWDDNEIRWDTKARVNIETTAARKPEGNRMEKSTDYKLTSEVRTTALAQVGLKPRDIKVDLFASEANAQAPLFCTENHSASHYFWKKLTEECRRFLWANPPFSDLEYVV